MQLFSKICCFLSRYDNDGSPNIDKNLDKKSGEKRLKHFFEGIFDVILQYFSKMCNFLKN